MLLVTGRGFNKNSLVDGISVLPIGVSNIFITIHISHNCFPSAVEPKLQRVHAYVGHPVFYKIKIKNWTFLHEVPSFYSKINKFEVSRAFFVFVGQIEAPREIVSEFFQP